MIGIDFETYGTRDLRTVGLDNYVADPEFRPLLCAVVPQRGTNWQPFVIDFMLDGNPYGALLDVTSHNGMIAQNVGFEMAVLKTILPAEKWPAGDFYDSAVIARCMGAGSSLEHASRQLLRGVQKMSEGKRLIQKFSIPTKEGLCLAQEMANAGTLASDPDWQMFKDYCLIDAQLGVMLFQEYEDYIPGKEWNYAAITHQMNFDGWTVDRRAVLEMSRRYKENLESLMAEFRYDYDRNGELNLNSLKQMKEWCQERGVKTQSFDEASVAKMIPRIEKKILDPDTEQGKLDGYYAVRAMLKLKQELGGSSLKKLKVILETTGKDGKLRHQYMHVGAGQSYRTSGRGVQMQNLKRLKIVREMEGLYDDDENWTNDDLAENIRQVFTSSHPDGRLVVGDLASIESRGLAWLAGEDWKLEAYARGEDLYKVQASKIFGTPYGEVTKGERQTGKVGELSCGYGAGPAAVQAFAAKMGIVMSDSDSGMLVREWRAANPKIEELWNVLDTMLHQVVDSKISRHVENRKLKDGWTLTLRHIKTPDSLWQQHPGAKTLELSVTTARGELWMRRVFQGCYKRGNGICYYKPSALVNGQEWTSSFVDPKTKVRRFHNLYGGKLAGILTQSFCRELFFKSLSLTIRAFEDDDNVTVIGQFHDEIVVDWTPDSAYSLDDTRRILESCMTSGISIPGFPMGAEVNADYRYTK